MLSIRYLALAAVLFCTLAAAQRSAPATVALNIEPQPIRAALEKFADQTGLQVVLRDEDVRAEGVTGSRVVGELSVEKALGQLLAGTDLRYEFVNARTVKITRQDKARATGAVPQEHPPATQMRLARAEGTDDEQRIQTHQDQGATPDLRGIPEILVKGRKSLNTDIQRTEDDVQPYVVFTAEDIKRSMAVSLDQFLMANLPMNASRYRADDVTTTPTSGNISSINLRGLGANQTLILVNGRRMPGVSMGNDLAQPDINGIPMSSIERIEVLPSTAGGIYGGGATGGVINIILKGDYRGLQVNARYDGTFRRDAASRVLEASSGFSLWNGRTTVMLSGSYRDSNPLLWGDRDFAVRGRQQVLQNNPAGIISGSVPPMGATTNIRSGNGQPLVLAATGQSLGSLITHVPYGYAGPASDNGLALIANAGSYNLDWPTGTQGLGKATTSAPTVIASRLDMRHRLTDRLEAFLDASLSSNDTRATFYTTSQTITLQPGVPTNPFVQRVTVRFPGSDFDHNTAVIANSMALSVTGGLMLSLPRDWMLQAEYGRGRSERDYTSNASGAAFAAAMSSGALNILSDVMVYPLDYTPYLPPQDYTSWQPDPYGAGQQNASVRLAGPLVRIPGGPVRVSALVEHRKNEVDSTVYGTYSVTTNVYSYRYSPPRSQTVRSAYAEFTLPVFSAANALPLIRALDLQASYRLDRTATRTVRDLTQNEFDLSSLDAPRPAVAYQTNQVKADQYTLGLRYQPLPSLALRVSNAVGVLPPSLQQLVQSELRTMLNFGTSEIDPLRNEPIGNGGVVATGRTGGNPALVPEHSNSWSAGLIFTPSALPGLRASVDYTLIRKKDEISGVGNARLLQMESSFPDRIRRAALTPEDAALGYTVGRIEYFDTGLVNIASRRVEAYDFRMSYDWRTPAGAFQAELAGTHHAHTQSRTLPDSPVIELVGYVNSPVKWRGNAGITWERNAWRLGWQMQYFNSYKVYPSASASPINISNPILNQGGDTIPRQLYHDLSFSYAVREVSLWGGLFANSELLVGISNVLDTRPPLALFRGVNAGGDIPFQAAFSDPRMRRYSISLSKSFGGR